MIHTLINLRRGCGFEVNEAGSLEAMHLIDMGKLRDYVILDFMIFGKRRWLVYRVKDSKDMPKLYGRGGRPKQYNWDSFQIGQEDRFEDPGRYNSIRASISRYCRLSGRKFETKINKAGSLMIRRIK